MNELQRTCEELFNEFLFCASPVSQVKYLYRYGTLEDCFPNMTQFFKCMESKIPPPMERKATSPTEVVWKLKDKPSWTSTEVKSQLKYPPIDDQN